MKVCLCGRFFCFKIPWQDYLSVLLVGIGVLGISVRKSQSTGVEGPSSSHHNEDFDTFFSSGDCYKPNTDDLVNVELRRSQRITKPASCMLSPFTTIKGAKKKKLKSKDENENIKQIKIWYPKQKYKNRTCALLGGSIFPNGFWEDLFGDDSLGWFGTEHIYGWTLHLYETLRSSISRWSILPPYFVLGVLNPDNKKQGYTDLFDGSFDPFPNIADVDEVYVVMNIIDQHWILGVFNLCERTFTIYDSLLSMKGLREARREVICNTNHAFDLWLKANGYYGYVNSYDYAPPFRVVEPLDVPQQSGPLGDCGVWVCIFIERLIKNEPLNQNENTQMAALRMRHRMALEFYKNVLPEEQTLDTRQTADEDELKMLP